MRRLVLWDTQSEGIVQDALDKAAAGKSERIPSMFDQKMNCFQDVQL